MSPMMLLRFRVGLPVVASAGLVKSAPMAFWTTACLAESVAAVGVRGSEG